MTDPLPEPLVPAEVDLRGLEWMPYYGDRLARSEFNARSSDGAWRAGHNLWWAAWNSVPAASLPDDEVALTRYADLGRDVRAFRKIRAHALHGFIPCSDGRLYHPFLAGLALQAWDRRVKERDRKARWRAGQNAPLDETERGQSPGQDAVRTGERRGEDRTGDERTGDLRTSLRSSGAAAPLDMPDIPPQLDRRKPNGQAKTPRGSRLSAHWQPDAADTLFARQCGLDPERVAAEFRDYWIGLDGPKAVKRDWSATFRNRCRQLAERAGPSLRAETPARDVLSERRRPTAPPRPEDDVPVSYDE